MARSTVSLHHNPPPKWGLTLSPQTASCTPPSVSQLAPDGVNSPQRSDKGPEHPERDRPLPASPCISYWYQAPRPVLNAAPTLPGGESRTPNHSMSRIQGPQSVRKEVPGLRAGLPLGTPAGYGPSSGEAGRDINTRSAPRGESEGDTPRWGHGRQWLYTPVQSTSCCQTPKRDSTLPPSRTWV